MEKHVAALYEPNSPSYEYYGARGIQVCNRWRKFDNFLADMGPCPSKKHTIDRLRNDGDYEPGNAQWATYAQQARNTSRSRFVTISGVTHILNDWAQIAGIDFKTLAQRIKHGWPEDRLLDAPHTPRTPPVMKRSKA